MTDDDIRALLELEAKATPAPWYDCEGRVHDGRHELILEMERGRDWYDVAVASEARNAVRPLAEEVLRLRAMLRAMPQPPDPAPEGGAK